MHAGQRMHRKRELELGQLQRRRRRGQRVGLGRVRLRGPRRRIGARRVAKNASGIARGMRHSCVLWTCIDPRARNRSTACSRDERFQPYEPLRPRFPSRTLLEPVDLRRLRIDRLGRPCLLCVWAVTRVHGGVRRRARPRAARRPSADARRSGRSPVASMRRCHGVPRDRDGLAERARRIALVSECAELREDLRSPARTNLEDDAEQVPLLRREPTELGCVRHVGMLHG